MKLLFAEIESYDGLDAEKAALFEELAAIGVTAESKPLADIVANPDKNTAVVLQLVSGYHEDLQSFMRRLSNLEQAGVQMINSLSLVRWNSDKIYLRELEAKGHHTLPTIWLEKGDKANLADIMKEKNWREVVVKPTISAGAFETKRIHLRAAAANNEWLNRLLRDRAMMIQPFAEEIEREGEWSFLFFGGEFSHAVLKTPSAGDYRVQHVHGGKYVQPEPPAELLRQATAVLHDLPEMPAYGRVDGIVRDGKLLVMEVEVIEPFLYMLPDRANVKRAATAIADAARTSTRKVA